MRSSSIKRFEFYLCLVKKKMFLSAHKATKKLGISSHTLRHWSKQRKITASKKNYLYARVSSQKQKQDLERQKEILLKKYPTYELISDIGSGINFKRKGLQTLLEQSCKGLVREIVVTH